jgi:SNF2 family DNA or RNA helicase
MKTKGMIHQLIGLNRMEGKRNFALLMEQGTGKTWVSMADAERCFIADKIDALLVFAPNGVHINWTRREIPTHMEVPTVTYAWKGKPTSKRAIAAHEKLYATHFAQPTLRVFTINFEAVNTAAGYEAVERFLGTFRVMCVVDESTRIKNPSAKRTKKIVKLGRMATARRILSGTPLTKAPTDLYSQFDFLKSGLLGTTSYRAFVAEHAVLLTEDDPKMKAIMRKLAGKTFGMPQVVAEDENGNKQWRNLERLRDMIAPHSYRVRKEDCLDLPPKVYKRVYFELDAKQRRVYDLLKEDYHYVHLDSEDMSFQAIAARTKLKQVVSGFINIHGEPFLIDPKENPRMSVFKELIEGIEGQFIVWAMFEEEIKQIMDALSDAGISAAAYYGATPKEEREQIIDDFQSGRLTVFVGHAAAAGIGITLTAAQTAIYYSCSFDNELRLQSEDRCHRIGTKGTVVYYDIIAEDTIDEDVVRSLAIKSHLADVVIDGK